MPSAVTSAFLAAYPADAARILEEASAELVGEILGPLPAPAAAAVLQAMAPHAAACGLAHLPPDTAAGILRHLPMELGSALLLRLDPGERGALMRALPPTISVPLGMVLRFPGDSVGSLVDSRVVTVRAETRIAEATEAARRALWSLRQYLYVLDERQRLTRVVDARQCLLQDPALPIGRLEQQRAPIALRARTGLHDAARHPGWDRFNVLPVTDHRDVFLGVVRRMSLNRALLERGAAEPEGDLIRLTLDLADLYWQTAARLLFGTSTEERPD